MTITHPRLASWTMNAFQVLLKSRCASLLAMLLLPLAVQAATPLPLLAVGLEKRAAGTFYVSGAIQGYGELAMLVDTGSSLLVINQEILDTLLMQGLAVYSHDLGGAMADGSQRMVPIYRVQSVSVGKECWVHDVEAAVLPSKSRVILGMNVLAQLSPFTFSAEPPQLLLTQCGRPLEQAALN